MRRRTDFLPSDLKNDSESKLSSEDIKELSLTILAALCMVIAVWFCFLAVATALEPDDPEPVARPEEAHMPVLTLSLHDTNRILERSVPLEALEGVEFAIPLLTGKPQPVSYKGVMMIARKISGYPEIISAWKDAA